MIGSLFWGAAMRMAEAVVQAAPTILVGLIVAGIFRRFLGHEGTRRLFGAGTRWALLRAWLLGMLLPVCSLGAIPIAREMKRAGISGGVVLAFAMTAPLFNPVSLLYGLTLSAPSVVLAFAFCTMVVVTAVGTIWDRLFPGKAIEGSAPPPVASGVRRMAAIGVAAAEEIAGPSLGYIALGLLGVGLLAVVLPPGRLQATMEHTNPLAPLAMAAVATPAYATPLVAMSQLGSMFQHANSVGAAFVLLALGAGVNLGLIAWACRNYGWRRGLAWLGILAAVVVGLGYAIENPLHPAEVEPAGHTHAFDNYCRPHEADADRPAAAVPAKLKEEIRPFERVGLTVLGTLAAVGLALRLVDRRGRVVAWLEHAPEAARGRLDVDVPAPVLGGVALGGLVLFSVVGCYVYYPGPAEVFQEMYILRGEVLTAGTSGDRKHAERFIPVWDDWTRRLQVGVFLREGRLSPYRRMKAKVFRDRLEFLKHAIEEGDRDESREYVALVDRAYARLRRSYAPPG